MKSEFSKQNNLSLLNALIDRTFRDHIFFLKFETKQHSRISLSLTLKLPPQ